MSFETELISKYHPKPAANRVELVANAAGDDLAFFCDATAAVVRLDERLRSASSIIRAGWMARAFLQEAAASARLDEAYTDVRDLLLLDQQAPARVADQSIQYAHRTLRMLRAAARRHPRQLFTPRRLMATARLRLRGRTGAAVNPEWLERRSVDPQEIRAALAKALDPGALQALRHQPALAGAAEIVALWHTAGAADLLGGAGGRILASAWLRRVGLVAEASFLPSWGFLGHASDYRPARRGGWARAFLEASQRSVGRGLALLSRLQDADGQLRAKGGAQRSSSRLPALVDLLLASPAVSPRYAAEQLGISIVSARRLFDRLEAQNLVREITGRDAFRLFSATDEGR